MTAIEVQDVADPPPEEIGGAIHPLMGATSKASPSHLAALALAPFPLWVLLAFFTLRGAPDLPSLSGLPPSPWGGVGGLMLASIASITLWRWHSRAAHTPGPHKRAKRWTLVASLMAIGVLVEILAWALNGAYGLGSSGDEAFTDYHPSGLAGDLPRALLTWLSLVGIYEVLPVLMASGRLIDREPRWGMRDLGVHGLLLGAASLVYFSPLEFSAEGARGWFPPLLAALIILPTALSRVGGAKPAHAPATHANMRPLLGLVLLLWAGLFMVGLGSVSQWRPALTSFVHHGAPTVGSLVVLVLILQSSLVSLVEAMRALLQARRISASLQVEVEAMPSEVDAPSEADAVPSPSTRPQHAGVQTVALKWQQGGVHETLNIECVLPQSAVGGPDDPIEGQSCCLLSSPGRTPGSGPYRQGSTFAEPGTGGTLGLLWGEKYTLRAGSLRRAALWAAWSAFGWMALLALFW